MCPNRYLAARLIGLADALPPFYPKDQKAYAVAAQGPFRSKSRAECREAITELAVGEALSVTSDEKARAQPPVQVLLMRRQRGQMGPNSLIRKRAAHHPQIQYWQGLLSRSGTADQL